MRCTINVLLQVGSVSIKNTKNILIKNIGDASLGALCWWLLGYGVAFGTDKGNGFIGGDSFALKGECSSSTLYGVLSLLNCVRCTRLCPHGGAQFLLKPDGRPVRCDGGANCSESPNIFTTRYLPQFHTAKERNSTGGESLFCADKYR